MVKLIKEFWEFDPPMAIGFGCIIIIVIAIIMIKIWEHRNLGRRKS